MTQPTSLCKIKHATKNSYANIMRKLELIFKQDTCFKYPTRNRSSRVPLLILKMHHPLPWANLTAMISSRSSKFLWIIQPFLSDHGNRCMEKSWQPEQLVFRFHFFLKHEDLRKIIAPYPQFPADFFIAQDPSGCWPLTLGPHEPATQGDRGRFGGWPHSVFDG